MAAVSASDMSEMDHPGYSCKYEFFHEHGQLFITELENNGLGERLQLVPQSSLTGLSIKADRSLPVRLRELHSHWYNHDRQILLFRPRHFTGRPADFIAFAISIAERDGEMESAARGAVCEYSCRRIPIHLRGTHWRALIATYHNELKDELVRVEGCVITKMLSKFEQVQYIHHFRRLDQHAASQKEPLLSFELPRLNLEFELQRRNEVVSKEYDGYCLRHCQQLVTMRDRHMPLEGLTKDPVTYTLNGFTEYLILERRSCSASSRSKRAEVLVLVPAGTVRQTQDGKVSITTPPGAGASFKVRPSNYHIIYLREAGNRVLVDIMSLSSCTLLTCIAILLRVAVQHWFTTLRRDLDHPIVPAFEQSLALRSNCNLATKADSRIYVVRRRSFRSTVK